MGSIEQGSDPLLSLGWHLLHSFFSLARSYSKHTHSFLSYKVGLNSPITVYMVKKKTVADGVGGEQMTIPLIKP